MKQVLNKGLVALVVVAAVAAASFLSSCDVGLGALVNTEVPIISQPPDMGDSGERVRGDFLRGDGNLREFEIRQDFGLSHVFMELDFFRQGNAVSKMLPYYERRGDIFVFSIDTLRLNIPDGPLTARIVAVDVSGNRTTTTNITYQVKNALPQIQLVMPALRGEGFDRIDAEGLLHIERDDGSVEIRPLLLPEGFDLMGLASDALGIADGYPQILIWPVDAATIFDEHGLPVPVDAKYGTWRPMLGSAGTGTAKRFSWPMLELVYDSSAPGGWGLPQGDNPPRLLPGEYRVRLRVRDLNGEINYYPNRSDHQLVDADAQASFMQIRIASSDIPQITLMHPIRPFNGADDFVVPEIRINANNPLDLNIEPPRAWIMSGNTRVGEWPLEFEGMLAGSTSTGVFSLRIPAAQVAAWSAPAGGELVLHISARDIEERPSFPFSVSFTFDRGPPQLVVESPLRMASYRIHELLSPGKYLTIFNPAVSGAARPFWVVRDVLIAGSVEFSLSGLSRLYYHIGSLGDDIAANTTERRQIFENFDGWIDTGLHPDGVFAPGWSGNINNWRYMRDFNEFSGEEALILSHTDLGYTDADEHFVTAGKNRFFLPFYIKAVDNAGNIHIINYKLSIDPDLEIPVSAFVNPVPGERVGGIVRISGTAGDINWIGGVVVRITKEDDLNYFPAGETPFDFAAHFASAVSQDWQADIPVVERNRWFAAEVIGQGPVVNWFVNLNSDGGLNPVYPIVYQNITVEVRALSTLPDRTSPNRVGYNETMDFTVTTAIPSIGNPVIRQDGVSDRPFRSGMLTSGRFTMAIDIRDRTEIDEVSVVINGIRTLIVQGNGNKGVPLNVTVPQVARWEVIDHNPSSGDSRTLELEFDSTDAARLSGIFGFGMGGNLNVQVSVMNTSEPQTSQAVFSFAVDNFFPNAEIHTSPIASGEFSLLGVARDHRLGNENEPQIQGIERILIFFEEANIDYSTGRVVYGNGRFFNHLGNLIPQSDFVTRYNVMDTTLAPSANPDAPNVPVFNHFPRLVPPAVTGGLYTSPAAIIVDRSQGAFSGLVTIRWSTSVNTIHFADGPYMVHYIVLDEAGNATRYTRDIFIQNRRPLIDFLNVGSDIYGDGSVVHPQGFSSDGPRAIGLTTEGNQLISFNPPARIRGNTLGLRLDVSGGNRPLTGADQNRLRYVVSHVTRLTPPAGQTGFPAAAMVRGGVYTITDIGTTDWAMFGAPSSTVGITFVATSPGIGTGRVQIYEEVSRQYGSFLSGETIIFDDFSGITDGEDRLFIIKVYDFAVPAYRGGREADQLSHAVLVSVTVENNDVTSPVLRVADFGAEYVLGNAGSLSGSTANPVVNYNRNIVMDGNTRLGFVQYAQHSNNSNADVSGKVFFTGKITDNHRVTRLTAQIQHFDGGNGVGQPFDIASWNAATRTLTSVNTVAGVINGTAAWGFEAYERLTLDWGHEVTWRFAWDTSTVANVAMENITVTFMAYDGGSRRQPPPVPNAGVPQSITVDVVPFITEIVTGLSRAMPANPSAFSRSALGWHPVRENEEITIRGFNLQNNPAITLNGTPLALVGNTQAGSFRELRANIGITATSGELNVIVNNIDAINNRTNVDLINPDGPNDDMLNRIAPYNWEPNNLNNNILTNRRNLYVWTLGFLFNEAQTQVRNPFMRMDSTGRRFISYGWGHNPANLRVKVNNELESPLSVTTNRYINTTIVFDEAGDWYVGASNVTTGGTGQFNFGFHARVPSDGANDSAQANKRRILSLVQPVADVNRVRIPRIFAQNTNGTNRGTNTHVTRIFMSYFDGHASAPGGRSVVFHYGLVGDNLTLTTNAGGNFGNGTAGAIAATGQFDTNRQIVASPDTTHRGSMFTAVGALSNGLPVIAWFDEVAANLVFSFGNGTPTTTDLTAATSWVSTSTLQWQANARVIGGVASGKGSHVDMAIDSNDNIHLAFYNQMDGGLWYAFIPHNGAAGADRRPTQNEAQIHVRSVDTFNHAGLSLMINVRLETRGGVQMYVPYISYFHNTFAETSNSIRVAWPVAFETIDGNQVARNGTHADDTFTGHWEVMTIPTPRIPLVDHFITNGVPSAAIYGGSPRQGWHDPADVLAGQPLLRRNTELNNSIVVGFMTPQWYEGAILRHRTW